MKFDDISKKIVVKERHMARVTLLEKEDVDPMVKALYQKIEDNGGEVINLLKVLAHSPKIFRDWNRMGITLLLKGDLSHKLRELAILRVGDLARANYEWTKHVPIAMQAGASQEQIDALPQWKDATCFDKQERAVLQYTDEVALDIRASEETFEKIAAFLSQKEIIELTTTIGYYGMVSRVLESLQIELEI
jgi:4-carboxymuconolactone decarboxylase